MYLLTFFFRHRVLNSVCIVRLSFKKHIGEDSELFVKDHEHVGQMFRCTEYVIAAAGVDTAAKAPQEGGSAFSGNVS